ncbi:hypothetical protein IFR04_004819 [Cadophora malorum]|uniref:Phospholipase/carboxylesterase/thioesterase domain-containing protein n=1 Tax=Cadophora malorum TaxID=108018 RepID=A0A8H8BSG6_9HELO|nr:hypothetical protein IFR04_004819 [Cadophora malorum]
MASLNSSNHFDPKPELSPPNIFPEPLIIMPALDHRQSIIILHGRGSIAARFAPPLLATKATGSDETLQTAFPHAKLIFPTASRTRATIYKRSYTHQWFDNWHLDRYAERQDLMTKGLRSSVQYIHGLLEQEFAVVGAKNVVLWGLSQGCATSLATLLTWDGEPLAAAVGMCGWLPFSNIMVDMLEDYQSMTDHSLAYVDEDDPFALSEDEGHVSSPAQDYSTPGFASTLSAVNFLMEELNLIGTTKTTFRKVPIFLGHGMEDDRVNIELGREAQKCLRLLEADVQMTEYNIIICFYLI